MFLNFHRLIIVSILRHCVYVVCMCMCGAIVFQIGVRPFALHYRALLLSWSDCLYGKPGPPSNLIENR